MDEFWKSFLELVETNDKEASMLLIQIMKNSDFFKEYENHKLKFNSIRITFHTVLEVLENNLEIVYSTIQNRLSDKNISEYIKDLTVVKILDEYGKSKGYLP